MSTRHRAREIALQILYRYDVSAQAGGMDAPRDTKLIEDLNGHFEHFQTPENIRSFTAELVSGTLRDRAALDEMLEKHAANWRVSRMGLIDRNLLRMATYEMLHFPDIPATVTIDEAIELSKQFGTQESPSFINGILDAIKTERETRLKSSP